TSPRHSSASPPPAPFITQVAPPPPPSFTKDSITPKPATPYTPPPPPVHPAPANPLPVNPMPANPALAHPLKDRAKEQSTNRAPAQAREGGRDHISERAQDRDPDRAPDYRGADPTVKPKGNPAMTPASKFPSPPSMSREDGSKSPGSVQPPNQTLAFNG